jgi:hypothetical protein
MSIRRLTLTGLATLGFAAGGLAALATQAWAVNVYSEVGHFGSPGAGDGEMSSPTSVAIDNSTGPSAGDVYIADAGNYRVEKFTSSGTFLAAWGWGVKNGKAESEVCASNCEAGLKGSGAGQFSDPTEIAVDSSTGPSSGDVYVADKSNRVVEKFGPSGEYLASFGPYMALWGVATDPSGNVWVFKTELNAYGNPEYVFNEFNGLGKEIFRESANDGIEPGLSQIAVDSKDNLDYVRSYEGAPVREYDAGIGDVNPCRCATGLAVDQASNDLFIAEAGLSVAKYGTPEEGAVELTRFGSFGDARGVAFNLSSKAVYVADASADQVDSFEEFTNVPGGETLPITELREGRVTLNAKVNPEGIPITSCQFEYGTTVAFGKTAPCSPAPGSGNTPVAVSATLTSGLVGDQFYHYRVAVTNKNGTNYVSGLEFLFVEPPAVDDVHAFASSVHQSEATLNGVVNPQGVASTYHFVWGLTSAYGSVAPYNELYTPVNGVDDPVEPQRLVGLAPGTTYHFALVATNAGGITVGPDETFTTPAIPLPGAVNGPALEVTRTGATLTGTVDPEGQSTTYWYEYGPSAGYGERFPATGAAAGEFVGAQSVAIALPNLLPGTTYHYRLVAQDGAGTVYSADATFMTSEFPTSVVSETPFLKTPLGINPETTKSITTKSSGKSKHKKKKAKAKKKKAKHKKKG